MAGTTAVLFFPAQNITAALLQAFSVFTVGYLARPVGGIIFGHLGDKLGRQRFFTLFHVYDGYCYIFYGIPT